VSAMAGAQWCPGEAQLLQYYSGLSSPPEAPDHRLALRSTITIVLAVRPFVRPSQYQGSPLTLHIWTTTSAAYN